MLDYVKNINSIEYKNKNLYRVKEFKEISIVEKRNVK